jgi:hypothetical protein
VSPVTWPSRGTVTVVVPGSLRSMFVFGLKFWFQDHSIRPFGSFWSVTWKRNVVAFVAQSAVTCGFFQANADGAPWIAAIPAATSTIPSTMTRPGVPNRSASGMAPKRRPIFDSSLLDHGLPAIWAATWEDCLNRR